MASTRQDRQAASSTSFQRDDHDRNLHEALEILDEGYLVRWAGIDPETGEPWKPSWMSKGNCTDGLVARWEAAKAKNELRVRGSAERGFEDGGSAPPFTDSSTLRSGSTTPALFSPESDARKRSWSSTSTLRSSVSVKTENVDVTIVTIPPRPSISNKPFEIDENWLLDPIVSTKGGMVVVVRGSVKNAQNDGWHGGDYEGSDGVVLSVFNTGIGNTTASSTARVRFMEPIDPSRAVYSVPVQFLWPVEPRESGQDALILDGMQKGDVARVRVEEPDGWLVSVRNLHFTIAFEKLVQVLPVE
ncbi:hypothetical protein A0H81_08750 [Grifola frondosa]|uniref:Chromo domain-containing protein n=1 Tax=Grifola frondosa TaxID=5627 RepID=A0A1C7M464_GRIFR|nr:hypothetical protein A0H81_08750 [Grifola frondosa]